MDHIVDNLDDTQRPQSDDFGSASAISRAIEEDIAFGRLTPGTPLREERLLERFGGSRHLVRDALSLLAARGMIVREKNRGASVRVFSAEDVHDVHDVRELLQRQAALRIPLPVSEAQLAPLSAIESEYEACVAAHDSAGMHAANERFHDALFALCGNHELQRMIRQMLRLSYLVRVSEVRDEALQARVIAEHRLMIELLRGTDGWALSQLCVAHSRPRRDAYLAYLAEQQP